MTIMTRLSKTALGFALSLALGGAASAQFVPPPAGGVVLNNSAADLSALANRIQRQQYQQQQQRFREDDRLALPHQPLRPDLPVIKPACSMQLNGGGVLGGCR